MYCIHCGTELDYPFYCPSCCEDLYADDITTEKPQIMSKWDKIKKWVKQDRYIPKNISLNQFISNIISQYKADLAYDDCPEDSWPLESWYETLVNIGGFDYE
jgi:hypothetical protein